MDHHCLRGKSQLPRDLYDMRLHKLGIEMYNCITVIFKPAQSIVSRIFIFLFALFSEANLQVSWSIMGTRAAVSSLAILFTLSAAGGIGDYHQLVILLFYMESSYPFASPIR